MLIAILIALLPCKGITKAGTPCKSVIVSKAGYCRIHNPDAKHCPHVVKGKQCGMITDGSKCRFHKVN
jgi:hypothetical protein